MLPSPWLLVVFNVILLKCFRCGCGRLKNDHEQDIKTTQNEVWSSSKHSEEMPTDSFGLVSFSEEDQDAKIASKVLAYHSRAHLVHAHIQ